MTKNDRIAALEAQGKRLHELAYDHDMALKSLRDELALKANTRRKGRVPKETK